MDSVITSTFNHLWDQYTAVTPSADRIHQLLSQGDDLVNDHIAIRTYDLSEIGLERLAAHFLTMGYRQGGEYRFEEKRLHAKHYDPPAPSLPKVFISELETRAFSPLLQEIVGRLVSQLSPSRVASPEILYAGRCWQLSYADYLALQSESEYAAWMAAWGFRANHFTVSINHLSDFHTIQQVNAQLEQAGFTLNQAGGKIKGSPDTLLEQSSTLADMAAVEFCDGVHTIPSCFYEFALRYPQADGTLFGGFVPASADKIFESTHNR